MGAIEKAEGPCVILAGAGTGKTYTIVEKVKYLIENKIYAPEKIVCITFSNEAANNLAGRIDKILGSASGKKPVVRTFHGLSADFLRKYGEKIGISKDFKILEPDQAKVMLHRSLRINPGNCHKYISTIGTAKDLGIKIESFQGYLDEKLKYFSGEELEKKLEEMMFRFQTLHIKNEWQKKKSLKDEIKRTKNLLEIKKFTNAWNAYEKLKKKGNYQDYSDLNKNALELLEKNPELACDFSYVIVDEFQDTNKLQLDFLIKLAWSGNISVVGDVNQSIYRFRGAYKDNLLFFKKALGVSEKDIFTLAKSYRSPNKVLRAAHSLILNNYSNADECFFVQSADSREGENIEAYRLRNSREEARKVVEIVEREKGKGIPLEEICVIFRTHQQGRVIRQALEEEEIPYVSVTKSSLTRQKSIKTARDFLIIMNKLKRNETGGEGAWWDLVYQLDFSRDDLIKIGRLIKSFGKNGRDREQKNAGQKEKDGASFSRLFIESLPKAELSERGKTAAGILIEKISQMMKYSDRKISEILIEIYGIAGLANEQKTQQEKEAMLNLNKFYEMAKLHEELYDSDMSNFLYYLDVLEELGIEVNASSLEEEGVRLMTSHSTKGLEFKVVIVTNLAQGRFPIEKYISNSLIPTELLPEVKEEIKSLNEEQAENFIINYEKYHQLLEERRLAYVSFTRAKEKLILTFSEIYGNKKASPSQFLSEINYASSPDITFRVDDEEKWKESFEIKSAYEMQQALYPEKRDEKKEEYKKLSPSSLILFDNCQKQFEYKYVYNMPERKTISWEAMRFGSFVHLVLEKGVSLGAKTIDEFLKIAREKSMDEDWEGIELGEAEMLIKIFFERNRGKYNEKSKTEQYLSLKLEGMDFIGFADRIDFSDKGIDIIDYKTGKTFVPPRDRNWQLGFYALAAKDIFKKNVRKVTLEMLNQEKPLEFEIDEKGNAVCKSAPYIAGFNINEVEKELVDTARKIREAYVKGFKPCPVEKNCEFCNEYVYEL